MTTRKIKMELRKININISREYIEDLRMVVGNDWDENKALEELLKREQLKIRKQKLDKIKNKIWKINENLIHYFNKN